MMGAKLKTTLIGYAVGIVLLVSLISTIVVSFIIYRQNEASSNQILINAVGIAKEEIATLGDNLLSNARQLAAGNLGESIDYVNSFDKGDSSLDSTARNAFRELVSSIYTICRSGGIPKTALYGLNGNLIAFVNLDQERAILGYPFKGGFDVIELMPGESPSTEKWKSVSEFKGMETDYKGSVPKQETSIFSLVDNRLSREFLLPVKAQYYNKKTEKLEKRQIAFIRVIDHYGESFAKRLARLSGTVVNVFVSRAVSIGGEPGYKILNIETFPEVKQNWNFSDQSALLGSARVGEASYFQGILPLFQAGRYVGAIVALYSTDIAKSNTLQMIWILCMVSLGCIVLLLPLSVFFARSQAGPLERLGAMIKHVENSGDFSPRADLKGNREIREIAIAFNSMMDALQSSITSINLVMKSTADGDLSEYVQEDYRGDLNELSSHINDSVAMLSQTIEKVTTASQRVNNHSLELAASSQSLASGTSEQAASLEQVSSSMAEISSQARSNNDKAGQAREITANTIESARQGNRQMQNMLESMNQIATVSQEVNKIIKVIDEIAFQTNLLALNAAVEAARAGKYGKGFAVVAEEVRSLAARSAEAAKSTSDLIQNSTAEVKTGVLNADKTAEILTEITEGIEKSNILVEEISAASNEQTASVEEINKGLGQVNNVVQQNSSISEQAASAAEELASQAKHLQALMSKFILNSAQRNENATELVSVQDRGIWLENNLQQGNSLTTHKSE